MIFIQVDNMRIGVFFNDSSVPSAGGAFTQREAIIESILQSKSDYEFFYFFYGKRPTNTSLPNCIPLSGKSIGWILKKLYFFTGFEIFKKLIPLNVALKSKNIDLVYFVEPNYQPVIVPYIASVWDITHLYYPFFPEMHKNEEWEKRELMYQRFLRKASYVVTSTHAGKNELEKYYLVPENKIKVIKTPIADVFFKQIGSKVKIIEKYSLPNSFFIYPAQLWAHKNHYLILSALKSINENYGKKLHVAFVGSNKGNKEYLLLEAKKMGVSEQIHFLGFIPFEDLVSLYKQAVGLIYTTFVGPEGLPPAEAFVLGCPVIASNINGASEQMSNAAILVDLVDSSQLSNAMYSIYSNKKMRNNLIQKGKILSKELTKEKFITKLMSIFDEFADFRKRWV
jgi:glycosyltransferase involved in cell wall biosynthesis